MEIEQKQIPHKFRNKHLKNQGAYFSGNSSSSSSDTPANKTIETLKSDIALQGITVTELNAEVSTLQSDLTEQGVTINERIDTEVVTLNQTIDSEVTTINTRINTEVQTLNETIDAEVDILQDQIDDLPNQYLSKVKDDSANGKITFNSGLVATSIVESGENIEGIATGLIEAVVISGASTLGELTNVEDNVDIAAEGSVLVKTGSTWTAQTLTTPATTIGELTNVDDLADTVSDGAILIKADGVWTAKAGWIEAATEVERDAKTNLRNGTQCYVAETESIFVYLNGEWTEFGTGGSGTDSGSVIRLKSAYTTFTTAFGYETLLRYNFTSLDSLDNTPTGNGTAVYTVNDIKVATVTIAQGDITYDIKKYIRTGSNTASVTVTDTYGSVKTIAFTIEAVTIEVQSSFDDTAIYSDTITYRYTPIGTLEKTIHFVLDDVEIGTVITSYTNRQLTYSIPAQIHGSHTFLVYATAVLDELTITSNTLFYDLICTESGKYTPIIAAPFNITSAPQYSGIVIPYTVYSPNSETSSVILKVNGETKSTLSVDRSQQVWNYKIKDTGTLSLSITCGAVVKSFTLTITESSITSEAETQDLLLYLTSNGRSNNENNPSVWSYGNISATLSNFNFTTNGWITDKDDCDILRVSGDARVTIPINLFATDPTIAGKTIEFEFATHNIEDYNTVIIGCMNGGRGIEITPMTALLASEQTSVSTKFKEDERVRISYVIEEKTEYRLIYTYINGIMSGAARYPEGDNFVQASARGITIGSSYCVTDIYNIRVYGNNLNQYQILDNYIFDMDEFDKKVSLFENNQIFDAYGEIVYNSVLDRIPCMTITGTLPTYKGDKKTVSVTYENKQDPSKSFTANGCSIDVQGTSSQYYPRKNYKIKFSKTIPITMTATGTAATKYALRDTSIPVNCFCVKADFAESSGVHNTGMAKIIDATLKGMEYLAPPQKTDSRVRTTVDGFPIVIFHKPTSADVPTFLGKYNFNNDKSTQDAFGFSGANECWEFLNNTSDRILFKSADFTTMVDDGTGTGNTVADWTNDFEARYPDDDTINAQYKAGTKSPDNLKAVCEWIVSTNADAATNATLAISKTYGTTTYTIDSAAYRLAKFKYECKDHFNLNFLLFYYLNTEIFAMVDQRGKNMFFASWGAETAGGSYIWYPIFYDNDTCLGINNEGLIAFDYKVEYHDSLGTQNVWNAANSTLWNNVEACFPSEIESMYKAIRSAGLLSYASMIDTFNKSQSDKWSESIYNADGQFKYIYPMIYGYLNSSNNLEYTDSFLYALQGSRAEHRKWWLYNRFLYIDSKYSGGDYQGDYITMRLYTPSSYAGVIPDADFTITPYADQYTRVKFGSYIIGERSTRNIPVTIVAPEIVFNDTETIIYGASRITSIGDLSNKYAGTIDLSKATKLTEIIVGSGAAGYQNTNLTVFSVGTNDMLKHLDIRNCPNLTQSIDLSGCANIKEVFAQGTSITSVSLPVGGYLEKLYLPATVKNLTVKSHPNLHTANFSVAGYNNLTTLIIENSNGISPINIAKSCLSVANPVLERIRFVGIDYTETSTAILDDLSGFKGVDANGNTLPIAYISGTFHINAITKDQFDLYHAIYPYLNFEGDIVSNYHFADDYVKNVLVDEYDIQDDEEIAYAYYDNTGTQISIGEFAYITAFRDELFYNQIQVSSFADISYLPMLTSYGVKCFAGSSFTSVPIPDRVTSIGGSCFKDCLSLSTVSLGGVTTIPELTFSGCTDLANVDLKNVTSIGNSAFAGCTSLTRINIPSSVSNIGNYAFGGCVNLKSIICYAATPPIISANTFPIPLVVYVPSDYVDIYKANSSWSGFTIYAIPEGDGAVILSFNDQEFKRVLVSLYDIDGDGELMKWEAALITSIPANTFKESTINSLVDLAQLVNLTSIGDYAFQNCINLSLVTIPDRISTIGNGAFAGCNNVTEFIVSGGTSFKAINGVLYNYNETQLVAYPNGKISTSFQLPITVTSIRDYAFKGTNKLVTIVSKNTTPATANVNSFDSVNKSTCFIRVATTSAITTYRAASGWSLFTNIVVLESIATINVVSAGTLAAQIQAADFTLNDVTKLIVTGYLNGTDILTIRNMINNGLLSDIDMSGVNIVSGGSNYYSGDSTTNDVLGGNFFRDCSKLKTLVLPNSVYKLDYNSLRGSGITAITIPANVQSIELSAFESCESLISVTIPNTVTFLGDRTFRDCPNLTTVVFNASIPVRYEIFKGCSNLVNVTLANTFGIDYYAFDGCSKLVSVNIPSSVTVINNNAFNACTSLTTISIASTTVIEIGTSAFSGCTAFNKIFVPQSAYFNYKEATGNWANYKSLIDCYITFATPTKAIKTYIYGLLGKAAGATLKASEAATLTSLGTSTFEADTNVGSFEEFRFFTGVTELPRKMFYGSDLSGKLYCPASLTRCGYYGINNCDSLTEVVLSPALTGDYDPTWGTATGGLGKQMDNCGILASVTIPEGITTIPDSMMQYCYVLNNVVFPSTITKIAANIFRSCTAILSVNGVLTFKSVTPPTLEADMFNSATFRGVIKVPSASVNAYKTATNWSRYASNIIAI